MANWKNVVGRYLTNPPVLTDTTQVPARFDVFGRLITTQEKRPTYSAAAGCLTLAANTTDFFTIYGSDERAVIVKRLHLCGMTTETQQLPFYLLRRSTENSNGTFETLTNVQHDYTDGPAQAVVRAYTANPDSLGTLIGPIRIFGYTVISPVSNYIADRINMEFGIEENEGIVLRGASDGLCFNLGGVSMGSPQFSVSVEWREIHD